MRAALLDNPRRQAAGYSVTAHAPASVGGLNTRDPLGQMAPLDAIRLLNFYPDQGSLVLRGGSGTHCTLSSGSPIKALHQYANAGGTQTLFACTDEGIYNVTGGGTVVSADTTITNGKWLAVNITNTAGSSFLWGCNGVDPVQYYDNTNWTTLDADSTPAITGVDSRLLMAPWLFKRKIFACERDSMNVWYLPSDSIGGTARKLPLGPLFKRGGYVMAGATWTVDAGDGPDDYWVVITSNGEVAVYQGTSPSTSATWALVGVYYVGRPIGRQCFFRIGGDLGLITEQGVFPLSRGLQSSTIDYEDALSSKIDPTLTEAVQRYKSNDGWEGIIYPEKGALLINVPTIAYSEAKQYVYNTSLGAWTEFNGWNATCWALFKQELYYGTGAGVVIKAWDDAQLSDNGTDITGLAQTSFQYFGPRVGGKQLGLFRLQLFYDGVVDIEWGFSQDYRVPELTSSATGTTSPTATWDVSAWDDPYWTDVLTQERVWRSTSGRTGFAHSLLLQISTGDSKLEWTGTDYIYTRGGAL